MNEKVFCIGTCASLLSKVHEGRRPSLGLAEPGLRPQLLNTSEPVCRDLMKSCFHHWQRWYRGVEEGGKRALSTPTSPCLPHCVTRCFDTWVMFRREERGVLVVSLCLFKPSRAVIEISFQAAQIEMSGEKMKTNGEFLKINSQGFPSPMLEIPEKEAS